MKKIHRVLAMLMTAIMALSLITTAFAEPTIDPGKKASLSIYKYDITKASNDGAWDAESYVSAGLRDDAVIDKLSKYAIQGVEFTYLRVADIAMNNEVMDGQRMLCLSRGRRKGAHHGGKEKPLRAYPAVPAPSASGGAGAARADTVRLHHGHTQRTF